MTCKKNGAPASITEIDRLYHAAKSQGIGVFGKSKDIARNLIAPKKLPGTFQTKAKPLPKGQRRKGTT